MGTHQEIEVKLEVSPEVTLPDLAGLPAVASVERHGCVLLKGAHFDTGDLRLVRARATRAAAPAGRRPTGT